MVPDFRPRHPHGWSRWPIIVLKSSKCWSGPKIVDGLQVEGTFRAHQAPLLVNAKYTEHLAQLGSWMKGYKAEELFDEGGRLIAELAELAPKGVRRVGANPNANGGMLRTICEVPECAMLQTFERASSDGLSFTAMRLPCRRSLALASGCAAGDRYL